MSREQPKRSSYRPPIPKGTLVTHEGRPACVAAIRQRKKFARRYRITTEDGQTAQVRREELAVTA